MKTEETTYDFVVSLGYDCHCATMLRKCGLRSCSSPLDLLTAAPLETRLKLVETRFAGFLEKGNMKKLEKEPGAPGKGNDHYEDTATGLRFFHDFRETLPFDESYSQVKAKYNPLPWREFDIPFSPLVRIRLGLLAGCMKIQRMFTRPGSRKRQSIDRRLERFSWSSSS